MSLLSLAKQPNAASLVGILIGTGALTDPTPLALGANEYAMGTGAGYTAKSISALAQLLLADATETAMRTRLGIELASGKMLVGSAGNVATPVTPTGDVTVSSTGVTAIGAGKVLNSMLTSMAANTIKCRASASAGDPGDLAITANTFPVRKSTGNIFAGTISDWMVDSFLFNNSAATAVSALGLTGNIPALNYQIFTSSGNFTKATLPTYTTHVIVEVWGAGGGGGGANSTARCRAVGGGGGGYSRKRIAIAALAASETVTIGAGGTGGTAGNPGSAGTAGGTTSFGTHCQATGGNGGSAATSSPMGGVAPGVGSGGDLNLYGSASETNEDGGTADSNISPAPGFAPFFGGTNPNIGGSSYNYGGGGSASNHGAGNTGGNGGAGLCIVSW